MSQISQPASGFQNLGNTCYINAGLQAIFHIPSFKFLMESHRTDSCGSIRVCVICSVYEVYKKSRLIPAAVVSPDLIYSKIKLICSDFIQGLQNDSHEFTLGLLNVIAKGTLFYSQFKGNLQSSIFCESCGYISTSGHSSNIVSISLIIQNDIRESLRNHFIESISGYFCPECQAPRTGVKKLSFTIAPSIIIVQLNRFGADGRKCTRFMPTEELLDLSEWCDTVLQYKLVSAVSHIGETSDSGHYTAICKTSDGFYEFDDARVNKISTEISQIQPYFMFYVRESPIENNPILESNSSLGSHLVHVSTDAPVRDSPHRVIERKRKRGGTTFHKTSTDRVKKFRTAKLNSIDPRLTDWNKKWKSSTKKFKEIFFDNDFGHPCSVCDRLWFIKDLRKITDKQITSIQAWYVQNEKENWEKKKFKDYLVCASCRQNLSAGKMPTLAKVNGFHYPDHPDNLPALNPISERLISPRLPFMQIRRLRNDFSYGIIGQVINIPVSVDEMVLTLPRNIDDDHCININIKKNLAHKSNYLSGLVCKNTLKQWLRFLVNSPLYKQFNIKIDQRFLNDIPAISDSDISTVEVIDDTYPESDVLNARQHTMIWSEEKELDIAPGAKSSPLNLIYDRHAEELSFPSIYYGQPRRYKLNVRVTPYAIATSEIRRRDRRGARPCKILYVAMKILRLRMVEGIQNCFRSTIFTENITRRMMDDPKFLEECLEKNFSFLKSVPNSVQYWSDRKKDVMAMIRQLGKPTVLLTVSANECKWVHFLKLLNKLSATFPDADVEHLTRSQRCQLVSEDPVTCCIYFNKFVQCLMKILTYKRANPFSKYRVLDYFIRIEFQHRGSPHAHILLWLENDPKEPVSENMPETIKLIEHLCSVSAKDVPTDDHYSNNIHQHTFTCTKRGETTCRFGIPYWPSPQTRVLIPLPESNKLRKQLQKSAKDLRHNLENCEYESFDSFLTENKLTMPKYLNIIRASIRKPTILYKRNMKEIYTNPFNPWISGTLNSNSDLQFILDEYSCAAYVVEYVNKSNRGMGNLHRLLNEFINKNPERDFTGQLKSIGIKLLSTVEISAQEASWFLLRQNMSTSSRDSVYIPSVLPFERQKCRKSNKQMNDENLDGDSTDVFTKNIIEYYEERPQELELVCLADFAAMYTKRRAKVDDNTTEHIRESHIDVCDNDSESSQEINYADDPGIENDEENYNANDSGIENDEEIINADNPGIGNYQENINADNPGVENCQENINADALKNKNIYYKRSKARIIRYRNYKITDLLQYKRELVLLFYPFRNELSDLLDGEKFISIFDEHEDLILSNQKIYDLQLNIEDIISNIKELYVEGRQDENGGENEVQRRNEFVHSVLGNQEENNDDVTHSNANPNQISVVRKRSNVMAKVDYCTLLRTTNEEQRELILEVIHRLHSKSDPIQIFFTGPAGCGKTYTIKLLMETYNRFTASHNSHNNSYVACASTGKAAIAINGLTVHSAFRLSIIKQFEPFQPENVATFRNMFKGVKCIIVDEISMLSSSIVVKVHMRLQQITGNFDDLFGGLDIILCGDLRQLPPVRALPVFSGKLERLRIWHNLSYFPLKKVVRQTDLTFSNILTKLGNGLCLEEEEIKIIEARHFSEAYCRENLKDVIRIYHQNSEVDNHNMNSIPSNIKVIAIDVIKIKDDKNNQKLTKSRDELHKMSVSETGGLPYILPLDVEYPYMVNCNIDVSDGLVNGSIGTLKFIEEDTLQNNEICTLWFEFPQPNMGSIARIKCRPHVLSNPSTLKTTWVPIVKRTGNIKLQNKTVTCHRKQFPVSPACALTIHKSQGGTFDKIIYKYKSNQEQQLVYVALSRVTNLEGLYIITDNDAPFEFKHGKGSDSQTMRDIRNEFNRLENHHLTTVTKTALDFIRGKQNDELLLLNMNVQSLKCHTLDLDADTVIQHCDILALNETWLKLGQDCKLKNYNCVVHTNNSRSANGAGGVAIFVERNSNLICNIIEIKPYSISTGDICAVYITNLKLLIASVYIYNNQSETNILNLLQVFMSSVDDDTPLIICGDFNFDISKSESLLISMKRLFNLKYNLTEPTTLGFTYLDITFYRYVDIKLQNYISYFSYHRPVLNKIKCSINSSN